MTDIAPLTLDIQRGTISDDDIYNAVLKQLRKTQENVTITNISVQSLTGVSFTVTLSQNYPGLTEGLSFFATILVSRKDQTQLKILVSSVAGKKKENQETIHEFLIGLVSRCGLT